MEVSCRSNERLGAGIERVGFVDIVRELVGCLPTKSGAAVVRAKVSTGAGALHMVAYVWEGVNLNELVDKKTAGL